MQLDVDYAVMCQAAKKWLDTLWVVDIGDFAMDGNGEVGVVTNRDKQDLGTDEEIPTKVAFVGVSYKRLFRFPALVSTPARKCVYYGSPIRSLQNRPLWPAQ